MKPKVKYTNGSWRVTGGLVPINICVSAYDSLADALDAVCRWYRGEAEPWVPYKKA